MKVKIEIVMDIDKLELDELTEIINDKEAPEIFSNKIYTDICQSNYIDSGIVLKPCE